MPTVLMNSTMSVSVMVRPTVLNLRPSGSSSKWMPRPTSSYSWLMSEGIPRRERHRRHVREETRLERGHRMFGDAFGRPAFGPVYRAHHADLVEKIDLVGAYAEDLASHLGRPIAGEIYGERRDLGRLHLLHLLDACDVLRRVRGNRRRHRCPGPRRDAVGAHVELGHVEGN